MAGKPRERAMVAEITRRMRQYFEIEDGLDSPVSLLDYVEAWTEDGGTLVGLATEVGKRIGFDLPAAAVSAYLRRQYGAESETRISAARVRASHVLAEQSVTSLDGAASDQVDASMRRERSKARQWLAGKWNREQYGTEKGGAHVSISFGSLHLDALRTRQVSATAVVADVPALPIAKEVYRSDADTVDAQVVDTKQLSSDNCV